MRLVLVLGRGSRGDRTARFIAALACLPAQRLRKAISLRSLRARPSCDGIRLHKSRASRLKTRMARTKSKNSWKKPDEKTAKRYIGEGYLWNSANFLSVRMLFSPNTRASKPESAKTVVEAVDKATNDLAFISSTKNHSKKRRKNQWINAGDGKDPPGCDCPRRLRLVRSWRLARRLESHGYGDDAAMLYAEESY